MKNIVIKIACILFVLLMVYISILLYLLLQNGDFCAASGYTGNMVFYNFKLYCFDTPQQLVPIEDIPPLTEYY